MAPDQSSLTAVYEDLRLVVQSQLTRLDSERERLISLIESFRDPDQSVVSARKGSLPPASVSQGPRPVRHLSAAHRRKLRQGQARYWAKKRRSSR